MERRAVTAIAESARRATGVEALRRRNDLATAPNEPPVPLSLLLLEDDPKLARVLAQLFTEESYTVDLCTTGADALRQARALDYALLVLDWMVPDVDGLEVCRELRRRGCTSPILMLTARATTPERVLALDAGADDYLVKPFEIDELLARARALVRRTRGIGMLRCGEVEVDPLARRATVAGTIVNLTDREYELLQRLARRAEHVVTRSELLAQVWESSDAASNLVEVHVSRLREKLGAHKWMVETVRGRGYRLRGRPPEGSGA
jgi:DNA-binding response OmpR family regulator